MRGPLKQIKTIECDRVNTILVIFLKALEGILQSSISGHGLGNFVDHQRSTKKQTKRETLREFTLPGEDNLFKVHFTHNHKLTIVLERRCNSHDFHFKCAVYLNLACSTLFHSSSTDALCLHCFCLQVSSQAVPDLLGSDLISTVTFTSKITQRHSFSLFYSSWYMLLLQPKALFIFFFFRYVHWFRCISFPLAHPPSSSCHSLASVEIVPSFKILSFDGCHVPPEVIGQNNYERVATELR